MAKYTKREKIGIFVRCGIALAIFAAALLNYGRLSTLDVTAVTAFTDNLWLKAAVVLGVYALKSVVFVIPASLIYVAVGGIFLSWQAVLLNLAGILLELTITFLFGKLLGRQTVTTILSKSEKGRKLLEKDVGSKPALILGIRAVPAFPIDFVSLLYGVSGCAFPKYLLFSFIGVSWRVILFTIIGDDMFKYIPMKYIILAVICCIPVGVVIYLVKKFRFDKRKMEETHENQ